MKKRIEDVFIYITNWVKLCIGCVILVLTCFVLSRMITQQILVDKLNMDGTFIRVVGFGRNAKDIPIENLKSEIVGKSIDTIAWEERYPFYDDGIYDINTVEKKLSAFTSEWNKVKDCANFYTTDSLFGKSIFEKIGEKYDELIQWNLAASQSGVIFLENGYLADKIEKITAAEAEQLADSVHSLYQFTKERDIDFLYVNAGSKICPYDKQLPYGSEEYTNENADALLYRLNAKGVPYLDMREEMINDGMDWYNAYYKTDHHWKTSTGLWAAGKIATALNNQYDYSFNLHYYDEESYEVVEYPNLWLGGQGRIVGHEYAEKESYEKIIPQYATDYTVEILSTDYSKRGSYEETMFEESLFQKVLNYTDKEMLKLADAYNCSVFNNNDLATIQNNLNTNNDGKRILMLQDSFSWYLSSYLAADIEKIDLINPINFSGSIRTYIEETKPDTVIIIYCAKAIEPIEWNHHHMFDLR